MSERFLMQYQMSGASAPQIAPQPQTPATAPAIVRPEPKRPQRKGFWIFLLLAVLAGGGYWAYRANQTARSQAAAASRAVRTATVAKGSVARTLRLSGSTAAERYSSLVTPQLRGGRGQYGRDGSFRQANQSRGGTNQVVQSNAGGGGSRSPGSSNSSISGGSGGASGANNAAGGTVASTSGNTTGGGSAAFRSSTSRISRGNTGNTRGSSGNASTPQSSTSGTGGTSSTGADGLGSTSGSLIGGSTGGSGGGGGGGGGGGSGGSGSSEFGLVLQDAVKPGAHVKKGDVVAEFDRQYMLTRLDDYNASVTQMEASYQKLLAELEVDKKAHEQTIGNAKAALDKARLDLKTIPVLGTIDAEKYRLAAEEAEAQYKQYLAEVKFVEAGQRSQIKNTELELQQAKLELRRAEANADRMLLKAPINGLAVMQTIFRGGEMAQVQPGDQLFPGMMFMQIVDTSSMIINAAVNQVDVDRLRIGAKARVRIDAYPGLELSAHVYSVGAMTRPGGQRASFVKEIPVILKLDKIDARVIPDLSVSCDVVIEEESDTLVAPLSAVFHDDSSSAPYVYVRNGDAWERREVQLGVTNNVAASVRGGLRPGEVVAAELPPVEIKKEQG